MMGNERTWVIDEPKPYEIMFVMIALIVMQGAFISLPILFSNVPFSQVRDFDNPLSRISIAISLLCIGWISRSKLGDLAKLARENMVAMSFMFLVLFSTAWSIHPVITFRRAVVYILTMLVAAILPVRFGVVNFMRILSWSVALSAIASTAFVLLSPSYGIMQEGDLAGCWQGVFFTKESLGSVMAVGVFVETYLLTDRRGGHRWRYLLIALYCFLIAMSRSMTALLTVLLYMGGATAFILWRRSRRLAAAGVMAACAVLPLMWIIIGGDSTTVLRALGKEPTLTGRTTLWTLVLQLVGERPVLGMGYGATWQSSDIATRWIDSQVGFTVPSSHNSFLEVALQLGLIGVVLLSVFLLLAVRRAARCVVLRDIRLGWFSILFVIGVVIAGMTTETLGQGQVFEWVVLNSLVFSCGLMTRMISVRDGSPAYEYGHD